MQNALASRDAISSHDQHEAPRGAAHTPTGLQSVMSTVDVDVVQMHQMGSSFRIDREDPRYLAALGQMRDAGVWDRIEDCLAAAWERLSGAVPGVKSAETVDVVLVLGDPDGALLTVRNAGYLGMGGIPGAIQLTMWPTATSLAKIGSVAAHEPHHNVRYASVVWNPMTVTIGEQVVGEGLAEPFVRELAGESAMGPWATALSGPELDDVCEKVAAGIDVAGMQNLPAYVYGDATAQHMGHQPVGLPDFAGYAAGLRIVDAHLAVSGLTAAQSTALPAHDILANAGVPSSP
ncbi:DUF2268 domain-containing protein [Streptomyces purpureus]